MKKINLTASIKGGENLIDAQEYEVLKKKKNPTWTDCNTQAEWLVKLHCLRSLFKENKIDKTSFIIKEQRLILKWWTKFCTQR